MLKPAATMVVLWCLGTIMLCPKLPAQSEGAPKGGLISTLEQANEEASGDKKNNDIRPKDVIHWIPQRAEANHATGDIVLTIQLTTERQFTIYSDKLEWIPPPGWSVSQVQAPATSLQIDPISGKEVEVYSGGSFRVTVSGPKGDPGPTIDFAVRYVGCTQVICLFPYRDDMTFAVADAVPTSGQSTANLIKTVPAKITQGAEPAAPPQTGSSFEEAFAKRVKAGSLGLGMLLLIAFVGGLLTNLTPCVAPMIPITIRLLSNQGAKPLFGSSMYALGIVVTYTVLGVIAAMSGALFGNLIANPVVSVSFGLVMALLGLSMLGFGDLSKLQQLGGRIGSEKNGPLNAFLMGTGAGLVASPCTGPILAALLTYTAGRSSMLEATALLGIYSIGFALPYVFLGASAAKISKIRVNFRLQIAAKLIFTAVMFGLSLYFLRIPLYGTFMGLQPLWSTIAGVSAVFGILFFVWILRDHGLQNNKLALIAPSFFLGASLFFGIQHLTRADALGHDSVHWYKTEEEAFTASKSTGKPILVDAWAEWCEACKKMDATTFVDPRVLEEIGANWVLLKMDLTEANDTNEALQDKYELPGLPTLTLLPAGGDLTKKKALNGYVGADSLLQELAEFRKASP